MPLNTSASGGYLSQTNALPAADTQLEDQLQEFIVGLQDCLVTWCASLAA
jgi:hypothetical protein